MEEDKVVWMDPKTINFSQQHISSLFRKTITELKKQGQSNNNNTNNNTSSSVFVLLDRLRSGAVKVEDIPPIRLFHHDNAWYTLDNRRLWVFREFGQNIPVQLVQGVEASKEFFKKFESSGPSAALNTVSFRTTGCAVNDSQTRLVDEVLRWSVGDIENDRLLVNQVEELPLDFKSLKHYLNSFVFLVLEEVRASLQHSLETIRHAPVFPVKSIVQKQLKSTRCQLKEFRLQVVYTDIVNKSLKPNDLVILTPHPEVESSSALQLYTLALLGGDKEGEEEEDGERSIFIRATVYAPLGSPEYKCLSQGEEAWYVVYLTSLAAALRTWDALRTPLTSIVPADYPIFTEILGSAPHHHLVEVDELGASQLECAESFNLNDSQMKALSSTVVGVDRSRKPLVRLIQGPPGTGKTSMLVAMLSVLSASRKRVLMSAPTNAAITEVVTRFLKAIKDESKRTTVSPGDVVLVGNRERLAVDDNDFTSAVFVSKRVERLSTALITFGGWRSKVLALIQLLNSAWDLYEEYRLVHDKDIDDTPVLSFLEFVRKRMKLVGDEMMSSVEMVCNDLPSCFIASTDILAARELLSAANTALSRNVSERTLRSWFDSRNVTDNNGHCLGALRKLLTENSEFVRYPVGRVPGEEELVKHARVVCCTVSSAGKRVVQQARPSFDVAIIDEASQVLEAETAIVIGLPDLKQLVLVGDHQQLPATVLSKVADECGYGRSLFQRLKLLDHPITMLNVQYRMHPCISRFPSSQFYDGLLLNGPNVLHASYGTLPQSLLYGPYVFLSVPGKEMLGDGSHSKKNMVEVEVIAHLVRRLNAGAGSSIIKVGVISPYAAQVEAINNRLRTSEYKQLEVETGSVDGFQGREKDVILLSTVRSNADGKIGFVEDYRRLNVAITRARHVLCVVGNSSTLTTSGGVWAELVNNARRRCCFLDSSRDAAIRRVIERVEAEESQLERLLDPESDLFSQTKWKVLFSREFKTSFTSISDKPAKQLIMACILNLAKGQRPRRKLEPPVPLTYKHVEIQFTSKLHLVWTVDVEPGDSFQVIKIWDIVTLDRLLRIVQRLEKLFNTYTSPYLQRCREEWKDGKLAIPARWNGENRLVRYKSLAAPKLGGEDADVSTETTGGEEADVSESLLLMKFYSLSSGVACQLLTASDGTEVDPPFEVTGEEAQVVKYPWSSFVIGRSGTGKTTVITMKLLNKETRFQLACGSRDGGPCLRQALITVSSKLCAAIKLHVQRAQRSLGVADATSDSPQACVMLDQETEERLLNDIPDSFTAIPSHAFPLVITYRKFLTMLDGSVTHPFLPRVDTLHNLQPEEASPSAEQDESTDEEEEEEEEESYTSAADDSESDENNETDQINNTRVTQGVVTRRREVDFNCFETFYWPRMNATLSKKFDASVVYTEIMSSIKGRLESLQSRSGRLSRESYVSKLFKRTSILEEAQRGAVYDLYLQYERMKLEYGDYDLADYVRHLYQQLNNGGFNGTKLDFVYVDEVQDLTLGQISLLNFISNNVDEGFLFAGDTAQTIAKGVSFRFEDIRSLFFTQFLNSNSSDKETERHKNALRLHQLTQNFRTHIGIVELADSVMQLILFFFPETVDKLEPETSWLLGQKPMVLQGEDSNSLITSLFDRGGSIGAENEFGAEQVILVRDVTCKQELLKRLGTRSLVLTIEECKGLEFQDVLLYNFFSHSPFGNKWRVLYGFLERNGLMSGCNLGFPPFDMRYHNLLCNELKQLYVAVTRSKQQLLIFDEDPDAQKPMLDYWKSLDRVRVTKLDDSLISALRRISTREEWLERGRLLFNEQQYDMAKLCFQRAGDAYRTRWAEAAALQQEGERKLSLQRTLAVQRLTEAAGVYVELAKFEAGASCLKKIQAYKRAAVLYRDSCTPPRLEDAGECFERAKAYDEAADAYFRSGSLQKCLAACLTARLLDKGLSCIHGWQHDKPELAADKSVETFLRKAAEYYHRRKDSKAMMKFVHSFPNPKSKRDFLRRRDYFDELIQVEESAGNFRQASQVAEAKGDLTLAAELLYRAGERVQGAAKLIKLIQLQLVWGNENRGWPLRALEDSDLLLRADKLAAGYPTYQHQLQVLRMSPGSDISLLLQNWRLSREDPSIYLIALRQLLDGAVELCASSAAAPDPQKLRLSNLDKSLDDTTTVDVDVKHQRLELLVLVWNTWFNKLSSLLKALGKIRRIIPQDEFVIEACMAYLGLEQQNLPGLCTVEDKRAFWLKQHGNDFPSSSGNKVQLRTERVVELAKQFWQLQLETTAQTFLNILEQHADRPAAQMTERLNLLLKILDELERTRLRGGGSNLKVMTLLRKYRTKLYSLLFLHDVGSLAVSELRHHPKVSPHLDALVKEVFQAQQTHGLSTEQLGMLQVLVPFMSRESMQTYDFRLTGSSMTQSEVQREDLICSSDFYRRECAQPMDESYFVWWISSCTEGLKTVFFGENWAAADDYIKPETFLYLLERVTVMAIACVSHVTDIIVTTSLAVKFMTGKSQEMLYSAMLQMWCRWRECGQLDGIDTSVSSLGVIANICNHLLTRGNDLEDWLRKSNSHLELSEAVFRLLRMTFTIFMDPQNENVNNVIYSNLKFLVRYESPLLPPDLLHKLQQQFIGQGLGLRRTLSEFMASHSDPFLLLRRGTMFRFYQTFQQVVPVEAQPWTFSLSSCLQLSDSPELVSSDPAQDMNGSTEEEFDVACTREELKYESPEVTIPEEEAPLPPWYIPVGDSKLRWYLVRRLRARAQAVRDKLQGDEYVQNARRSFKAQGDSEYVKTFIDEVCPLKASLDTLLGSMVAAVQILNCNHCLIGEEEKTKTDDLLESMIDFQSACEDIAELLDPRHERHREQNVEWLRNGVIVPATKKLEQGNKRFGHELEELLGEEACNTGMNDADKVKVDEKNNSNSSNSSNNSKSKNKKNKGQGKNKKK